MRLIRLLLTLVILAVAVPVFAAELTPYLVDWKTALEKKEAGIFETAISTRTETDKWISNSESWNKNGYEFYILISDALTVMTPTLNRKNRNLFNISIRRLVNENETVLKSELYRIERSKNYVVSLSSSTAEVLLKNMSRVDYKEVKEKFQKAVPKSDRKSIGGYDEFKEYIDQWIDLLKEAVERGMGLVIYIDK